MSTAKKFSQATENISPRNENILVVAANGELQRVSAMNMTKALMYSNTSPVMDFNEATETGLYCTHGANNPANSPTGVLSYCSLLEVFKHGEKFIFQRLIAYSGHICTRICVAGVWRQWNILTMTSSGGVKYCTSYAREREGGARYEYARKGIDKRPAERHPDGRSMRQRSHRRHGCGQSVGSLFCGPKHHSESSERHEVGQSAPTKFGAHDCAAHLRLVAREDICKDGIHSQPVALVQSYIRDTVAFGKEAVA